MKLRRTAQVIASLLVLASCSNPNPTPQGNRAPTAKFTASAAQALEPVTLDAGSSSDPDGDPLTYQWNLGDGKSASGKTVVTAFPAGTRTISLTVTDPSGLSASTSQSLTVTTPTPTGTTSLKVKVLQLDGSRLTGATVTVGGSTATSDAQGMAVVNVPLGVTFLARAEKSGFVTQAQQLSVPAGTTLASQTFTLRAVGSTQTLNATTGGTLSASAGSSVTLPANALVDAQGNPVSGNVSVNITPIPLADSAFPGGGLTISSDGMRNNLITYGMLDVEFWQGGNKLQLAAGKTAELKQNLAVSKHPDGTPMALGNKIPTWWFNDATGLWVEEGQGEVVQGSSAGQLAVKMTVSHFTTWNWDVEWTNPTTLALKCMYLDNAQQPTVPLAAGETCALEALGLLNGVPVTPYHVGAATSSGILAIRVPQGMSVTVSGNTQTMQGVASTTTGQHTTLSDPLIIPLSAPYVAPPPPPAFTPGSLTLTQPSGVQSVTTTLQNAVGTPSYSYQVNSSAAQTLPACNGTGGDSTVLPCLRSSTPVSGGYIVNLEFDSGLLGTTTTIKAALGTQTASFVVNKPSALKFSPDNITLTQIGGVAPVTTTLQVSVSGTPTYTYQVNSSAAQPLPACNGTAGNSTVLPCLRSSTPVTGGYSLNLEFDAGIMGTTSIIATLGTSTAILNVAPLPQDPCMINPGSC